MIERRGPKGRLKTTWRIVREPIECVAEWAEQYGDPFWFESMNGNVFISGREEVIKEIFRLGEDDIESFTATVAAPLVGKNSLLVTDGEKHLRDRKLLMPPLHGERMRAYNDTIQELAQASLACDIDENVDVHKVANQLTLSVIIELVFGLKRGEDADEMGAAIRRMVTRANPIFVFFKALQKSPLGLGPWASFIRAQNDTKALLQKTIDDRRREAPGDDVLSLMLAARYDDGSKMSDAELIDQLQTLLLAGHETTAVTATWIAHLIHQKSALDERLNLTINELSDDASEWAKSPYINALVDEALRYRILVPSLLRRAKRELNIAGHVIKKGEGLAACTSLAHFSEDNFDDAHVFKPERFLDNTYSFAQYMPFGGGIRRCIGSAFAKTELCIFTVALLKQGRYELLDPEVKMVRRNLTLAPDRPIRLKRIS